MKFIGKNILKRMFRKFFLINIASSMISSSIEREFLIIKRKENWFTFSTIIIDSIDIVHISRVQYNFFFLRKKEIEILRIFSNI